MLLNIKEENGEKSIRLRVREGEDFEELLLGLVEQYKEQKKQSEVPISIFSDRRLGVLEALVKFLKENRHMELHEIAKLLRRDKRTIWASYNCAKKKSNNPLLEGNGPSINIHEFSDRNQAPLRALINGLLKSRFTLKEISRMTCRSYKTIWHTHAARPAK